MPRKASEVGACKDLDGHIFTIGLENKGKDGNMLCTSMEKMTTYIVTKYGDEAAQEWTSRKKINLLSLRTHKPYWIGMQQGSEQPESGLISSSEA
jgi:hypothetical protein